jgi:hypothetical protein
MSTLECPWSTLTSLHTPGGPLKARLRAVCLRCRAPRGTADVRRRNHTCAWVFKPFYICARIYIQAVCIIIMHTAREYRAVHARRRIGA